MQSCTQASSPTDSYVQIGLLLGWLAILWTVSDSTHTKHSIQRHCLSPVFYAGSLPTVWTFGGPVVAVWGFVIVAVCSFLVALSLAELSSSYPLAGGPYFW